MAEFGPLIDVRTLERLIDEPDLVVLDCRFDLADPGAGRKAWLESHIPGARYADLDRDLAGPVTPETGRHPLPAPEDAAATFGALGVDNESRVVVYDDAGGAIAARAWWMLRWLGHERVALLDGGVPAWLAAGLPVDSGAGEWPRAVFTASGRFPDVVTTEEILAALAGDTPLPLVDARDERRYRGETEPIDPVAGHVPGAANLPFSKLLDEDNRFRSADEVRRLFAGAMDGKPGRRWAVMCGSGVTACHLALGAAIAGLPAPGIYIGSWSEWIRNPERPVAAG